MNAHDLNRSNEHADYKKAQGKVEYKKLDQVGHESSLNDCG
jgi:hypothetical protein